LGCGQRPPQYRNAIETVVSYTPVDLVEQVIFAVTVLLAFLLTTDEH
jgi:hypothetical protein